MRGVANMWFSALSNDDRGDCGTMLNQFKTKYAPAFVASSNQMLVSRPVPY